MVLVERLGELARWKTRRLRVLSVRQRGPDLVFWGLFAVCLWLLIRPLWIGPLPPLTDFGGHLQMVEAWARHGGDAFIDRFYDREQALLTPGLLPARFVALLHPAVDPITSLRLFVTLTMLGFAVGMMRVLSAFHRSRWLVFLGLPLLWNGMIALGLINYMLAMVVMLVAVALARTYAERGGPWRAVGLGAALIVGFLSHGIGCPLTLGVAGFVLVTAAPRWRALWIGGAAFVPATALWLGWYLGTRGELTEAAAPWRWGTATAWEELLTNGMRVTHEGPDLMAFTWIVGAWLVLLAAQPRERSDHVPPPGAGPLVALGRIAGAIRHELRDNTLLYLGLLLFAAYFVALPAYIGDTFISPRVVVPALVFLFLAPRIELRSVVTWCCLGVVVAATVVFAGHLSRATERFAALELRPLMSLLEEVPEGQRLRCVGTHRVGGEFLRTPLDHACDGLAAVVTGGFAGGGFAHTGFNAVSLVDQRDRVFLQSPRALSDGPRLARLDYVIVRGEHALAPRATLERVAEARAPEVLGAPRWTLYRVVPPARRETTFDAQAGGPGGLDMVWDCEPGMALAGVVVTTVPEGSAIASMQGRCASLTVSASGEVGYDEGRPLGVRFGGAGRHGRRVLECPEEALVVGVEGRTGRYVDAVNLLCARVRRDDPVIEGGEGPDFRAGAPRAAGEAAGGQGGHPFRFPCPMGSVAIGLRGASGAMIDAAGVACADVGKILAETRAAASNGGRRSVPAGDRPRRDGAGVADDAGSDGGGVAGGAPPEGEGGAPVPPTPAPPEPDDAR